MSDNSPKHRGITIHTPRTGSTRPKYFNKVVTENQVRAKMIGGGIVHIFGVEFDVAEDEIVGWID